MSLAYIMKPAGTLARCSISVTSRSVCAEVHSATVDRVPRELHSPARSFVFAGARPLRIADSRAEPAPIVIVANRDHAPALVPVTWVNAPRRATRIVIALRFDGARRERSFEHQVGEESDYHFDLRDFEMAAALTLAGEQRRDRSQSQHAADEMIRMNRAGAWWHPAFGKSSTGTSSLRRCGCSDRIRSNLSTIRSRP